jgi:uncharacterized membrane protein
VIGHAAKGVRQRGLWVILTAASLAAIRSRLRAVLDRRRPGSRLDRVAFQGTADSARALPISMITTVVTVIAVGLGLSVVALQLASISATRVEWCGNCS